MDGYQEMLGAAQQPIAQTAPQPQQQPGFAGVTQPMDPTVQAINRPAANPAEVQQRAGLWQQVAEKFQTDPSLRQAMMMMGAHLAQPNQPGQTTMGHAANSLALGSQVYNAGEYTKYEQGRQAAEDARKQAESTSQIALQGAQTVGAKASAAETAARTPGTAAASQLAVNTVDAKTQEANTRAQQAVTDAKKSALDLENATDQSAVDKIVRENEKRAATIKQNIPDATLQKAALAEVEAAGLKATEAKARIAASNAAAGASAATAKHANAQTAMQEMTNEGLKALPKNEQLDFVKGVGKYSNTQSALRTQADTWGKIYDGLPATDSHKVGKTKEQFLLQVMTESKQKDILEMYAKIAPTMSPDELRDSGLTELLHEAIGKKSAALNGGDTKGGAKTGVVKWGRDKNGKPVQVTE